MIQMPTRDSSAKNALNQKTSFLITRLSTVLCFAALCGCDNERKSDASSLSMIAEAKSERNVHSAKEVENSILFLLPFIKMAQAGESIEQIASLAITHGVKLDEPPFLTGQQPLWTSNPLIERIYSTRIPIANHHNAVILFGVDSSGSVVAATIAIGDTSLDII